MPKIVYAIPSYQRSEKQETLSYLRSCGIEKDNIFIFVQTEEDFSLYQQYENDANIVFMQAGGIQQARNNILNKLSADASVLMMDDDIKHIGKLYRNEIQPLTADNFEKTIQYCFFTAAKNGASIFGLYPIADHFFMDKSISTRCTVNTVIGFMRGFNLRFDETFPAKEDIELCGRILNTGKNIIRFNFLAPAAKHRTNKGGCNDVWKTNENEKAVLRLCDMYPTIFARHSCKKNEVRVIAKDQKIKL